MQGDTMPARPAASHGLFTGLMPFVATEAGGPHTPTPALPMMTKGAQPLLAQTMPTPPEPASPSHSRPRIVFVLMSAVAKPETVEQLALALAPHLVLVHHDFSQTAHFPLSASNVRFVPDPVRTGWAQFGFVQAIFHSLEHALKHVNFDYLQLLSPTCLPIKPLHEFERHISGMTEAHFDCIDLLSDKDALMSVGYRAFTAHGSWRHRLARRLVHVYFDASSVQRAEAGIWLHSGQAAGLGAHLAGWALALLKHPALGRHLRTQPLRLYYGSTWFGARRHVVAGMVRTWQQPGVCEHFREVRIAEEFLVPSLLMKTKPIKGALNHVIQRFDQAHPGVFGLEDLDRLQQSPAFFARKFPDDALAPVRQRVLSELVQCTAQTAFVPSSQGVHAMV